VRGKSRVVRSRPSGRRPSSALRDSFEFAGFALHWRRCVAMRLGKRAGSSYAVWKAAVTLSATFARRARAPIFRSLLEMLGLTQRSDRRFEVPLTRDE
jgi:hypothetical protein